MYIDGNSMKFKLIVNSICLNKYLKLGTSIIHHVLISSYEYYGTNATLNDTIHINDVTLGYTLKTLPSTISLMNIQLLDMSG